MKKEYTTQFDPDVSPVNPYNKRAAKERGWRYDPRRRAYVDSDGCIVADKFGQPV